MRKQGSTPTVVWQVVLRQESIFTIPAECPAVLRQENMCTTPAECPAVPSQENIPTIPAATMAPGITLAITDIIAFIPASSEPSGCLQTFGDCRKGKCPVGVNTQQRYCVTRLMPRLTAVVGLPRIKRIGFLSWDSILFFILRFCYNKDNYIKKRKKYGGIT